VVATALLSGKPFKASDNQYDWLGPGIYFWQSNPRRALQFAREKKQRERAQWDPAVVGAVVELGLCLDLTTEAGVDGVPAAHQTLVELATSAGDPLPTNSRGEDLLLRKLDCAVIRVLHDIRDKADLSTFDTVVGIFQEGAPIYDGSGFRSKTHIQISVRNTTVIKGVFQVHDPENA